MRAAILATAVVSAHGLVNQLNLHSFSCGNPSRLAPKVSQSTSALELKVFVWDDSNNQAVFYTSTHCGTDPTPNTFSTVDSCFTTCKTSRACATKVWPEHCDQGCEKDCAAYQANSWHIFANDAAYSGDYHIELRTTAGGVGTAYRCTYTKAELTSGQSYCAGLTTGASKLASWPPTNMDDLGQPWIQVSMDAGLASASLSAGTAVASITGDMVDSPVTTGTAAAVKIEGTSVAFLGSTCDGHCGTFAPGWGASCTHVTPEPLRHLGPGWHPTGATDCYCSCTTDCKIVGDCCDDYDLCSANDLTVTGGVVNTQAPTKFVGSSAAGDPFTEHAGKRTQFYLPLGRRVPLLQYKNVELLGEARPSQKKNDDQQWFKGFEIIYKGESALLVEAVDTSSLLRKAAVASTQAVSGWTVGTESTDNEFGTGVVSASKLDAIKDRLMRAKMELSKTHMMRESAASDEVDIDSTGAGRKSLRTSQHPLTTLNISIAGRHLERESAAINTAGGDIVVQVSQDQSHRIGNGFMETIWIETPGLGFQLQSSLAQKFEKEEEKISHMHINLKFNELNATGCTGLLPEIWGVQPMSGETIKHLSPLASRS